MKGALKEGLRTAKMRSRLHNRVEQYNSLLFNISCSVTFAFVLSVFSMKMFYSTQIFKFCVYLFFRIREPQNVI